MGIRSLPTAVLVRVDLSAYPASASAATESDLFTGYGLDRPLRRLPCACGGTVTADVGCPADGLREHQATSVHRAWRERCGL
jgi:hypothetical protein